MDHAAYHTPQFSIIGQLLSTAYTIVYRSRQTMERLGKLSIGKVKQTHTQLNCVYATSTPGVWRVTLDTRHPLCLSVVSGREVEPGERFM